MFSVRLADVNDLIPSEEKYHSCLAEFDRSTERIKKKGDKANLAFIWLCNEFEQAAKKSLVFQLVDVWERYVDLANDLAINNSTIICQQKGNFQRETCFSPEWRISVFPAFEC